jgi:hypothetical protein
VITLVAMVTGARGLLLLGQATFWATYTGCLLVLAKPRTAIHDRIAGTAVLRKGDVAMTATRAGSAVS